jgi:hypothetical protein
MRVRKPVLKLLAYPYAQVSAILLDKGMVFPARRLASIRKAYCEWTGETLDKDPTAQMGRFIAANALKEKVESCDSGIVGGARTLTFKPLKLDKRLRLMYERAQYQPTLIPMLSIKEQHSFVTKRT